MAYVVSPRRHYSTKSHGLGEALQEYFLHHHHHAVVLLEFPMDPLLPLPRWNEGREVIFKPYV
jgi:hypothetical protein